MKSIYCLFCGETFMYMEDAERHLEENHKEEMKEGYNPGDYEDR